MKDLEFLNYFSVVSMENAATLNKSKVRFTTSHGDPDYSIGASPLAHLILRNSVDKLCGRIKNKLKKI